MLQAKLHRDCSNGAVRIDMSRLAQKIYTAVWLRLKTVAAYVGRAPSFRLAYPWLQAGLVRTRICSSAVIGRLEVPLGEGARQKLSLDCASRSEMDVFSEVVVGRNYPFEKLPFTPSVVADCGANIGYFSCMARRDFPEARIFAWEPDARNFRRLGEQPLLRDGGSVLKNAAVSDHDGYVSLSGAGHGCEIGGEATQTTGVPCIDFPAWWGEHTVPCSLLKMDIEGHETVVLPALKASWKAPCAVFLETHAAGGQDQDVLAALKTDGFRIELLRQHSLPGNPRIFKEYFALLR